MTKIVTKIGFLLLALWVLAAPFSGHASLHHGVATEFSNSEYIVRLTKYWDRQVISFRGTLSFRVGALRDLERALARLDAGKDVVLALDSEGGSGWVFRELVPIIRDACPKCRLVTYIPAGSRCESACNHAFFRGDVKIASPEARFGFHAAYEGETEELILGMAESELMDAGVRRRLITALRAQGAFKRREMTYLTGEQLMGLKAVDVLSDASPGELDLQGLAWPSAAGRLGTSIRRLCERLLTL